MSRDSLMKFSEAILNEAALQKEDLISGLEERRKDEIHREKEELSDWKNEYINSRIKRMEDESLLKILSVKNRAFNMLIETRTDMFNNVFNDVEKNIREYVKSEEYASFIKAGVENAMKNISTGITIIEVNSDDVELMTTVANDYDNVDVIGLGSNLIGGFILRNDEMRLYIDNSLDRKIEIKKQEFYKNNELIIER